MGMICSLHEKATMREDAVPLHLLHKNDQSFLFGKFFATFNGVLKAVSLKLNPTCPF